MDPNNELPPTNLNDDISKYNDVLTKQLQDTFPSLDEKVKCIIRSAARNEYDYQNWLKTTASWREEVDAQVDDFASRLATGFTTSRTKSFPMWSDSKESRDYYFYKQLARKLRWLLLNDMSAIGFSFTHGSDDETLPELLRVGNVRTRLW